MTDNAIVPKGDILEKMRQDLDPNGEVKSASAIAATALARLAAKSGSSTIKFLSFDTSAGIMKYKEGTKLVTLDPLTTELAVDIFHIAVRWTCWIEGQVAESFDLSITDEDPDTDELDARAIEEYGYDPEACEADKDCTDGWNHSIVIPMRDMHTGINFEYLASNVTLRNSASELIQSLSEDAVLYDVEAETPIVKFEIDNYTTKGKKKYTVNFPKFEIKDWIENSELEKIVAENRRAATKPKAKDA